MDVVYHDKLVRDKIPLIIEAAGKMPVTEKIPSDEMKSALDQKLIEESREFLESHSIEELADVLEVLHGIAFHMGTSWEDTQRKLIQPLTSILEVKGYQMTVSGDRMTIQKGAAQKKIVVYPAMLREPKKDNTIFVSDAYLKYAKPYAVQKIIDEMEW